MSRDQPGHNGDNPNDPKKVSIVGKVPFEYNPKALNDITNAIRDQTSTQENAGNTSDGIANRAVGQQQRANDIARWALWVSGFAFAATIVVIVLNYKAIDAANRSATTADRTFKEAKDQFELSNRPFIQLFNLRLDSMDEGKYPVIRYDLTNTGHFGALVSELKAGMGKGGGKPDADTLIKGQEGYYNVRNDIGLIPFSPFTYTQTMTSQVPYSKGAVDSFQKGSIFVYLILEIKYSSLQTKVPYSSVQVLQITHNKAGNNLSAMRYTDHEDTTK